MCGGPSPHARTRGKAADRLVRLVVGVRLTGCSVYFDGSAARADRCRRQASSRTVDRMIGTFISWFKSRGRTLPGLLFDHGPSILDPGRVPCNPAQTRRGPRFVFHISLPRWEPFQFSCDIGEAPRDIRRFPMSVLRL